MDTRQPGHLPDIGFGSRAQKLTHLAVGWRSGQRCNGVYAPSLLPETSRQQQNTGFVDSHSGLGRSPWHLGFRASPERGPHHPRAARARSPQGSRARHAGGVAVIFPFTAPPADHGRAKSRLPPLYPPGSSPHPGRNSAHRHATSPVSSQGRFPAQTVMADGWLVVAALSRPPTCGSVLPHGRGGGSIGQKTGPLLVAVWTRPQSSGAIHFCRGICIVLWPRSRSLPAPLCPEAPGPPPLLSLLFAPPTKCMLFLPAPPPLSAPRRNADVVMFASNSALFDRRGIVKVATLPFLPGRCKLPAGPRPHPPPEAHSSLAVSANAESRFADGRKMDQYFGCDNVGVHRSGGSSWFSTAFDGGFMVFWLWAVADLHPDRLFSRSSRPVRVRLRFPELLGPRGLAVQFPFLAVSSGSFW